MQNKTLITRGAFFIALGILLPIAFHFLGLGRIFLPMHLPILVAGFLCGPRVGLMTGMVTPLLSALLTGMPPLMPPMAQLMIFELGAYGLLTGLFFHQLQLGIYPSLLIAMLGGRLVHGLLGYLALPIFGLEGISLLYPLTYGLLTGLPGVVLQLILVPGLIVLIRQNSSLLLNNEAREGIKG